MTTINLNLIVYFKIGLPYFLIRVIFSVQLMFSCFQGPAIYAFNNGLFDEEDWKGLRMLSESVKQNDPFKVGYFGMGFKSVFHLTGY